MKELFISYTQAKELKELGFDEPCFGYYYGETDNHQTSFSFHFNGEGERRGVDVNAPLKQQVFSWFREKHNLYADISTECTQINGSIGFSWRIWKPWEIEEYSPERKGDEWSYETYEQAESECIDKMINLIKNK